MRHPVAAKKRKEPTRENLKIIPASKTITTNEITRELVATEIGDEPILDSRYKTTIPEDPNFRTITIRIPKDMRIGQAMARASKPGMDGCAWLAVISDAELLKAFEELERK